MQIKEESKSPIKDHCDRLEMSQASSCDYSLSQFKDESLPHSNRRVKIESDEEEASNFVECKGQPEEHMYYENEGTVDDESEEDIPLSKRKKVETDSEDDAPLSVRKKLKTEKEKKKKRAKKESDDDEDDESDYGKAKKKKMKKELLSTPAKVNLHNITYISQNYKLLKLFIFLEINIKNFKS
jgi:DNA topoisomerase I